MKELLTVFGKIANISPDDCRQVRKNYFFAKLESSSHSVEVNFTTLFGQSYTKYAQEPLNQRGTHHLW